MEVIQLSCLIGFVCIIGGMIAVLTGQLKFQHAARSKETSVFRQALKQITQSPATHNRQ